MVAFDGDVVLQGLVDVVMGYVIKHGEILDPATNHMSSSALAGQKAGKTSKAK